MKDFFPWLQCRSSQQQTQQHGTLWRRNLCSTHDCVYFCFVVAPRGAYSDIERTLNELKRNNNSISRQWKRFSQKCKLFPLNWHRPMKRWKIENVFKWSCKSVKILQQRGFCVLVSLSRLFAMFLLRYHSQPLKKIDELFCHFVSNFSNVNDWPSIKSIWYTIAWVYFHLKYCEIYDIFSRLIFTFVRFLILQFV